MRAKDKNIIWAGLVLLIIGISSLSLTGKLGQLYTPTDRIQTNTDFEITFVCDVACLNAGTTRSDQIVLKDLYDDIRTAEVSYSTVFYGPKVLDESLAGAPAVTFVVRSSIPGPHEFNIRVFPAGSDISNTNIMKYFSEKKYTSFYEPIITTTTVPTVTTTTVPSDSGTTITTTTTTTTTLVSALCLSDSDCQSKYRSCNYSCDQSTRQCNKIYYINDPGLNYPNCSGQFVTTTTVQSTSTTMHNVTEKPKVTIAPDLSNQIFLIAFGVTALIFIIFMIWFAVK